MTRESRSLNIRVGIFMLLGIVLAMVAIFMVGSKSGLFEGEDTLYVHFGDINGLVQGAPVRLAGLDVGTVQEIRFPEEPERREAVVKLSIKSRYMPRIREDSLAFIDSKGLLGDKLINITLGTPQHAALADGATLKTKSGASLEQLSAQVGDALTAVTQVTRTADTAIQQLTNEEFRTNLNRISSSVANLLEQIEHGDGLAHGLIYDPKYNIEVQQTLAKLRMTIERIDRTVAAVETGDGLAHELLFGQQGKDTMAKLHQTADELAAIVTAVRDGNGLLHGLIYEPENARALTELSQASTRINSILGEVEKGRGTLGGLVVDPSVYEDLKTVLGNIERNVLLKALIRFTIKEGDIERPANLKVQRTPQQ